MVKIIISDLLYKNIQSSTRERILNDYVNKTHRCRNCKYSKESQDILYCTNISGKTYPYACIDTTNCKAFKKYVDKTN